MAKPELGTKRVCVSCGARFYDMLKPRAVCPKCGTEQPADQPRSRRTAGNVIEEKRPKKVVASDDGDSDVEVEAAEDETEEGALEDASELEDDADAIPDEIEAEAEPDEVER